MDISATLSSTISSAFSSTGITCDVSILLIDGFALMSYAAIIEPMRALNDHSGQECYVIKQYCLNDHQAVCSSGAIIPTIGTAADIPCCDMLFVIAGGSSDALLKLRLGAVLRDVADRASILVGVSGAPLLLASAGVMKNRRMTVHWEHASALSRKVPSALLEKSLYVMDRDRITCAGGTAPLDMMHFLITKRFNSEWARKISDWFLHTHVRPSEDSQQASIAERYQTQNSTVLASIGLMRSHFAEPMSLEEIAGFSDISIRQLNRLFHQHLGQSPMQFYRHLRLKQASSMLKNLELSITDIALSTGFSSSAHFATVFRAEYGASPTHVRLSG